jgi:Flp pilus assembly protein TadD
MKNAVDDEDRTQPVRSTGQFHNVLNSYAGAPARKGVFLQLYTSRYYVNKGIVLHWLGQRDKAISSFRTALSLDWRHETAALWLSRAERVSAESPSSGSCDAR